MFRYELRKIFTPKKTIFTLIILALISCAIFFMDTKSENHTRVQQLDRTYTGCVTSKVFIDAKNRADEIRNNPKYYTNPKDPETMKSEIRKEFDTYETAEFCISFNEMRKNLWKDILKDAKGSTGSKRLMANEYSRRVNHLKDLTNGDTTSISFLERYIAGFLPFVMAFVIAMFVSPLFASEYELKTDSLLLSSRHGKKKLIHVKILAAVTTTTILYAFVVLGYFFIALIKWGMFETKASFIFTEMDSYLYWKSPFEFTMGQYFRVMLAVSFAVSIVFCLFTVLLSSFMKKTLIVAITSMLFVFVPFIITKSFGMSTGTFSNVLRFNFANMMSVRGLFDDFYAFVIGGHVVSITTLLIPVLVLSGTVYYWGTNWIFKNHQV